jgi:cell division protein FtsB
MKIKTKFEKNLESHINLLNDDKDYIKEKIEQFAT